jgi:hypothetical protein
MLEHRRLQTRNSHDQQYGAVQCSTVHAACWQSKGAAVLIAAQYHCNMG